MLVDFEPIKSAFKTKLTKGMYCQPKPTVKAAPIYAWENSPFG